MRAVDLKEKFGKGGVEKKLYWQLMRENYTHILPEIQGLIAENECVKAINIKKDGIYLERQDNIIVCFDFTQSICRAEIELLMDGDPEKKDMDYIKNYLSTTDNYIALDIGANVGVFSLGLYAENHKGKYYLFEPVPTTFKGLEKNLRINVLGEDLFVANNIGLSDSKGQFVFYVPSTNEAASLVQNEDDFYNQRCDENGNYTNDRSIEKVICDVSTLDDYVSEHGLTNISFIKIDVEGNEKAVLSGGRKTLSEQNPLIYCELLRKHAARFGYHPNDVINLMKEYGYSCYKVEKDELVDVEIIDNDTAETNFFFKK